jgi:leader peptidase (prepilin peptidase)/N-methyltransferase
MLDPHQANWIVITWMSVIGAVIGSFLNVVVYRLPLGMSLIEPPSHCPKCKHLIRWFDNVPVFGWIMRWGRCRDCGNPISLRYPIVEAITALIFGLLTSYEFLAEGRNLPQRLIEVAPNISQSGLNPQNLLDVYESLGICLFHLLLLCTLLCAALIEIDDQRPPLKLFLPALLVGLAAPVWWPWLRPMPWQVLPPTRALSVNPYLLMGAIDGLIGWAAGAALGGLLWGLVHFSARSQILAREPGAENMDLSPSAAQKPLGMFFALSSVGLFLGWQAVLALAVAALAVYAVNWLFRRVLRHAWQLPATVWLLTFTLLGILFWARIATLS